MTHLGPRNSTKTLEVGLFSITYGNNASAFVVGDYFDFTFDSGNLSGYSGDGTDELTLEAGNYIIEAGLSLNKSNVTNSIATRYNFQFQLESNGTLDGTIGSSDAYYDQYMATSNQSYLHKNTISSFSLKLKLIDILNGITSYSSLGDPRTMPEHSYMTVWREI